jgi:hypothetical protein
MFLARGSSVFRSAHTYLTCVGKECFQGKKSTTLDRLTHIVPTGSTSLNVPLLIASLKRPLSAIQAADSSWINAPMRLTTLPVQ